MGMIGTSGGAGEGGGGGGGGLTPSLARLGDGVVPKGIQSVLMRGNWELSSLGRPPAGNCLFSPSGNLKEEEDGKPAMHERCW
jgi:hypothetical protein